MSDAAYAAEVDRKRKAGIKLTQPIDQAAYNRGKATTSSNYGMSDTAYAAEVDRKRSKGIPLTRPLNQEAYNRGRGQSSPSNGWTSTGQQNGWGQQNQWQNQQQYSFPYEQMLRDILAQPSAFNMPSDEDLLKQAQQYADLQINPYLSSLDTRWGQEQAAADTARKEVEAAYAGLEEKTNQALAQARQAALESAISRGAGRSGVVDWRTSQLEKPIYAGKQQAQAEQAAKLAAIANALSASQSDIGRQRSAYELQRGTLQSNQLAALKQQAIQQALAAQAQKWGQAYGLANLGLGANQFQQQSLMDMLNAYLYG